MTYSPYHYEGRAWNIGGSCTVGKNQPLIVQNNYKHNAYKEIERMFRWNFYRLQLLDTTHNNDVRNKKRKGGRKKERFIIVELLLLLISIPKLCSYFACLHTFHTKLVFN